MKQLNNEDNRGNLRETFNDKILKNSPEKNEDFFIGFQTLCV